jgi:hypothetical protein
MNIEAENPRMDPDAIAEMVLSFFSGICIERNLIRQSRIDPQD